MLKHNLRLRHFVQVAAACIVPLAVLVAGCEHKARHALVLVSGRVTVKGKPVADASVSFQPTTKPGGVANTSLGSYGVTDQSGKFLLQTIDGMLGAVVGRHVVRLTPQEPEPETGDLKSGNRPANPFPPKASDGSLAFEVPPGGTDQANFDF